MSPETKIQKLHRPVIRKRWTAATSRELADKILDGQAEPEEVTKEHGLQSYQLWAWVGKRAHERARAARREAQHSSASARVRESQAPSGQRFTADEVLALAEVLAARKASGK